MNALFKLAVLICCCVVAILGAAVGIAVWTIFHALADAARAELMVP